MTPSEEALRRAKPRPAPDGGGAVVVILAAALIVFIAAAGLVWGVWL